MKKRFFWISLALIASTFSLQSLTFGMQDNLKKAVLISAKGTIFQSDRLKIAAENLANEYSTSSMPGGDAYRRKLVIGENRYDTKSRAYLLHTKKIDVDKSDFIMKYDPRHPAANEYGYVKYPNIIKEIERADASEAERSYEANLSVIEMSNSLMQKTMEAIR